MTGQLSIFPDAPPPAPPPRRHRCPSCHAGFAPVGASDRISAQRAAADRDYTEAWERIVAKYPEAIETVIAFARAEVNDPDQRPSIGAVWNEIRGRVPKEVSNNNLRSAAARWLMATVPELAGKFAVRGNAGQVAP